MKESKEIKAFIKSTLEDIKEGVSGVDGFELSNDIEFDLAVLESQEINGGFKIYVANAGGKMDKKEISHIRFSVIIKKDINGKK